jgi:ADP-ribose pyrophosphatase YjhB (NUDIX family)
MKIDKSWYVKPDGVAERLVAGGAVVRKIGRNIFILLINEGGLKWVLPKGGVEKGESLIEAAMREIKEESGASDIILFGELGIKERLTFEKDFWSVVHYFLFLTNKNNGKPSDISVKYKTKWFLIDNLPDMFWPEQRELIEENQVKIKKLLSK